MQAWFTQRLDTLAVVRAQIEGQKVNPKLHVCPGHCGTVAGYGRDARLLARCTASFLAFPLHPAPAANHVQNSLRYWKAIMRARSLTWIFMAEISESISSMNCTTKSMSLRFHMASRLKFVSRKLTS